MDKAGDHQISIQVEDISAVVLIMGVQLLLGKMQGILPADLPGL